MKHEIMQRIEQIRRGETPKGYIRLHYYIIPAEWTEVQLSKLGMWVGGGTPSKSVSAYWHNGTIFWISSQEVKESIIRKTKYKITTRAVQESATTLVPPNTIVVVSRSGILQHTIPIAKTATSMAINQDIKALILNQLLDVDYVINAIKSKEETLLRKYTKKGTTVESLLFDAFSNFVIPYAPKEERAKIAAILTTQDKVIELKEKRLAEKLRQKKYLMQQLLTGKKRLPGHDIEWEEINFNDVFTFGATNTFSRKYMCDDSSGIRNIHYGDILVRYGEVLNLSEHEIPSLLPDAGAKITAFVDDGDVVIADTAEDLTAGKVVEVQGTHGKMVSAGLHTMLCKPVKYCFAPGWLGYYMNSETYHQQLVPYIAGVKVMSISKGNIVKTHLLVPSIEEQAAIVNVFSTADREISLLRQDIEQEKQKKKALMQLLLTGIVRVKT